MISIVKTYPTQIVFDGNSLMQRGNNTEVYNHYFSKVVYAELIAAGKKCSMQNYAIGGKTTSQLIADFPTKMQPNLRPGDIVVFMEMTNECATTLVSQTLYDQYIQYRDLVYACGCKLVVLTCPARNEGVAGMFAAYSGANTLIRNNASQFNGVADIAALSQFDAVVDVTNTTYYVDQVHVTNVSYDLWKPVLVNAISPLL